MTTAEQLVGHRIMRGSPSEVSDLAVRMHDLADDADEFRGRFKPGQLRGLWTGDAANAFAETLGEVPDELAKVSSSYRHAGDAMSQFSWALREVQDTARELARRQTDAQSRSTRAGQDLNTASRELRQAQAEERAAQDPAARSAAHRRVDAASHRVATAVTDKDIAAADLRSVADQVRHARHTFECEVRRCCHRLEEASHLGIRNTFGSWYERHVEHGLGQPVGWLLSPTKALVDLMLDPSLANLSTYLDKVGTVLGIAALVLVFVPGGQLVAAGLAGLAAVVALGKLGVDAVRVHRGEVDESELWWDGLDVALVGFSVKDVRFGVRTWRAVKDEADDVLRRNKILYGPDGRPKPLVKRAQDAAEDAAVLIVPKGARWVLDQFTPPEGVPCGCPPPPVHACPGSVVRHTRPIPVRASVPSGAHA